MSIDVLCLACSKLGDSCPGMQIRENEDERPECYEFKPDFGPEDFELIEMELEQAEEISKAA